MASTSAPRIQAYKADAPIVKGKAVIIGSDNLHVMPATGAGDFTIGIAQNNAPAVDDLVEVAIQGGGAKGLLSAVALGGCPAGALLTSTADGSLTQAGGAGERIIAVAMENANAGDLFDCEVIICKF